MLGQEYHNSPPTASSIASPLQEKGGGKAGVEQNTTITTSDLQLQGCMTSGHEEGWEEI